MISSSSSEPRCASSSRPGLSVDAPVKAPLTWPNSSDSIRSFGQRRAVDLHHRAVDPGALGVDRVGGQLLAGAALADDQHVGVRRGHRLQHLEDPLDRRGGAEHLAVGGLLGELAPQVGGLGEEPAALERLADQHQHLVGVEGLGDEVEGALLGRLHRLGDGPVPGHDDDLDRRVLGLEQPQQVEAVAVGQDQVHDGQGELAGLHAEHGADRVARGLDVVALALEGQAEILGDDRLVIDDEDARLHAFQPSTGRFFPCHPRDTSHAGAAFRSPAAARKARALTGRKRASNMRRMHFGVSLCRAVVRSPRPRRSPSSPRRRTRSATPRSS